jgi:hypothetical protein
MWALKVMRSTMAATSRGSGNTVPHSLKGMLLASPMLAFLAFGDDLEQQFGSAGVDLDVPELVERNHAAGPAVGNWPRKTYLYMGANRHVCWLRHTATRIAQPNT